MRDLFKRLFMVLVLAGMVCACTDPIQVERVSLRTAYAELNRSALSANALSDFTRTVLRRQALLDSFGPFPDQTIAALRGHAIAEGMPWPMLFALAEMHYLRARDAQSRADFFAAALYAYAVLFPEPGAARPTAFDTPFHQAANLYNLALTAALSTRDPEVARIEPGAQTLPFGTLDLKTDLDGTKVDGRRFVSFTPTLTLRVTGFQNIYRTDGVGAPMAAGLAPPPELQGRQAGLKIPDSVRVPSTAVLVFANPRRQLAGTTIDGTLSVYSIYETMQVALNGEKVPLQFDQTTARALLTLEGQSWRGELAGLFGGALVDTGRFTTLMALEPHRKGRMPVVLVHGTASSPFRWADMVNDLLEDPRIRENFEFWFFTYPTGNPIPYSALLLRHALDNTVSALGGTAADPALGRMVVIGHSQGGLLAKMLVVNTGDTLWNAISRTPLQDLRLSVGTHDLLQAGFFLTANPYIESVVFIATPHRGSYLADFSLAQWITRFITLPLGLAATITEVMTTDPDAFKVDPRRARFNAVAGMRPGNPLIEALANLPIAPPIRAYSIIPTLGDGPLEDRTDGVVAFRSAHLPGVQREVIVPGGHSTQSNPLTVRAVQEILLDQLNRGTVAAR